MSYERVIPRDLFNESSLLKCYGRLYIVLEGYRNVGFEMNSVSSFDVIQRQDDGALYVENLPFTIGEHEYRLARPLNSRAPWPLYAERIDDLDFDPVCVFTDSGEMTLEMSALVRTASTRQVPSGFVSDEAWSQ